MKLQAYAVFDKSVGAFLPVFFVRAKGEALRHFTDAVNDPKTPFNKHPVDYYLAYLFSYDDTSGQVSENEVQAVLHGLEALEVK